MINIHVKLINQIHEKIRYTEMIKHTYEIIKSEKLISYIHTERKPFKSFLLHWKN